VSTALEGFWHHAAQNEPTEAGGKHHEREGHGKEKQGDERRDREAYEQVVVEGASGDPQDRLDHDRYDDGLHPVEKTPDRRHVGVGDRQVGEQPQHEDRGDHEEGASNYATQGPVQPPADVGGDLLRLGSWQKHAEVERPQVLPLRDPTLLLDQFPMHDRDLPRRPPEVDEA